MIDTRTDTEHHKAAARALKRAIYSIHDAIIQEDDLSWDELLRDLLEDAESLHSLLNHPTNNEC